MAIGKAIIVTTLDAAGALALALPLIAQQRPASGPVARYDMRAGTVSGFMGGMGSGSMMSAMMGGGGGNNAQHELLLRLGSSRAPDKGNAKADHFMPPNARLGKSVALMWKEEKGGTEEQLPQKPKGRMLLFWGCGDHAPKGQPVVIDFARMAAGQVPPGLWTSTIIRDWGPTAANSKTFGRWPSEDRKYVKADSSLPGAHRVVSTYAPQIDFTLTKDFMQPLRLRTANQPVGSTLVTWNSVPEATGYVLWSFGGKGMGNDIQDMVMWTSSASRQFGGGLNDWLSPGQVANLVRDRTVLPPTATSCTVPAEVKLAGPDFRMGMINAFGPQEDFSYPPRPADPRAPWNLEWTARIRHRSMSGWMEAQGMTMGTGDDPRGSASQPSQPACKPKRGLGGLLGGAMGMPGAPSC